MLIEGAGVVAHRPHIGTVFYPYRYEKIIPHSTRRTALRSLQPQ